MNRLDCLKATLMQQKVDIPLNMREWVTTHAPLLSPSIYSFTGRRLNHFQVGSDPEFVFCYDENRRLEQACELGLRVGLAAGADQNERLVELRPWPSTSVIEHVTGILTAMRWLARVYPQTLDFKWRAGAFFGDDGIGGHVHFGRKRPTRDHEIVALDGIARVLGDAGIFSKAEWARRMAGDTHGQHYGQYGDMRVQAHGYEYRTMPSWLQTPEIAFIALTVAKLAVLDPELTKSWTRAGNPDLNLGADPRELLRGLAKVYRSRDDDAYLLYHILTRTGNGVFNIVHDQNIFPNWGIRNSAPDKTEAAYILPPCIQPDPSEVKEMEAHLLFKTPLEFKKLPPSFKAKLPANYVWLPLMITTGRYPGFGDLIRDLVVHESFVIHMDYINGYHSKLVGRLPNFVLPDENSMLAAWGCQLLKGRDTGNTTFSIPRELCKVDTIGGLRAMLLYSGIFPIWTVDSVEPDSFLKWTKRHPKRDAIPESWRIL